MSDASNRRKKQNKIYNLKKSKKGGLEISTWIGAELIGVGERTVALVVPGLDFDKVSRVRRQAFDGCRHFIADDAFDNPVAITLGAIRRVEDNVTCKIGNIKIQSMNRPSRLTISF